MPRRYPYATRDHQSHPPAGRKRQSDRTRLCQAASETEEKQYVETQPPTTQTKESKIMFPATKNEETEVNILGSMQGSVDLFISTYNNYFVQFPKIRTEAKYRKKAVAILVNLKKYIEKVEGELQ